MNNEARAQIEMSGSQETSALISGTAQPVRYDDAQCKNASKSTTPSPVVFVLVLTAICFVSINNYFCYHEPSAIAAEYEDFYALSTQQFGALFTIYSAPNVVLVFFSGQLIDRFGLRRSSILFNALVLLGMFIAAVLPSPKDPNSSLTPTQTYALLLVSRLILGLGGESICACVSTMISRWFAPTQHLNTAMALNQASVQLFGSAAAFYILPHVREISAAQWITVAVCTISLAANLLYNFFDASYQDYLVEANEKKDEQLHLHDHQSTSSSSSAASSSVYYQAVQSDEVVDDVESSHTQTAEEKNIHTEETTTTCTDNINALKHSITVLFEFPTLFWLLLLHISLVSPILYTFTAFGPLYLQETFPATKSATAAGDAISLLYMSIVAAPFTGMLIDYVGYRSYVQFFASCLIPVLFFVLTYGWASPAVCMVCMGVIFSITESNGLALISMTVPSELTGTAFGLYACCISIALLIEPASVGYIREWTGSFALSIWIFTGLTFIGAMVAFLVIVHDRLHENIISKPAQ